MRISDGSSDVCSSDLVSTLDMANLPRDGKGDVDFSRDFFGKETFLTVSGKLNVEAYCLALSKVYTFGPTFRAENSNRSEERRVRKECVCPCRSRGWPAD